MAARNTPSQGAKPDKLWRGALALAVKRPLNETNEAPRDRLTAMAEMLVAKAIGGDVQAAKEIGDRLDGKPAQSMDIKHDASDTFLAMLELVSNGKVATGLATEPGQPVPVRH